MKKPHATPTIRMRSCCMWAAGAFISLLALSPMPLQASNNDSKASQAQQKDGQEKDKGASGASSNDRNDNKAASAEKPTDLQSCKQDADGKKGPERSRFMTACLRDRK